MSHSPLPTQRFTSLFRAEELEERIEFWSGTVTGTVSTTTPDGTTTTATGTVTIDVPPEEM